MKNEELKKKIVEIVLNSEITGIQVRAITGGISMANSIADAIIAAEIGDVSSEKAMRELAEAFYREKCAEYDLINYKLQKAEYRAELEERALKTLIKKRYTLCEVPTNLCDGIGCRSNECQKIILEYYLQQAEKELEEEKENE